MAMVHGEAPDSPGERLSAPSCRAASSMGDRVDTRLSISAGKWGSGVAPSRGDALDPLLGSAQRRALEADRQKAHRVTTLPPSPTAPRSAKSGATSVFPQRPETDLKERFLAQPMTPASLARYRSDQLRAGHSDELKALQARLMADEGRPCSILQKELVYSGWHHSHGGQHHSDENRDTDHDGRLKQAIMTATGHEPSRTLIKELRALSHAEKGSQVDYDKLLEVVWDQEAFQSPQRVMAPGRGNVPKYLFLVGQGAGCYNDNIQPQPSLYGVKKGSSSVRYSLFTNEPVDLTSTFKLVPPPMMKAVDDSMKMMISQHPVTGRPLDPWMAYLAASQGKRCGMGPPDQRFDILKMTQKTGQSREWDCLPNISFGKFTKMHKGQWHAAERRNLIL